MQDEMQEEPPAPDDAARHLADLRARIQEMRGTLRVACALVRQGRRIDLAGLEEHVGRLCAASLDLAPGDGRAVRADLFDLRADAEALLAALQADGAQE